MKPRISYSAIVLPDSERAKLLSAFGSRIPDGEDWTIIAHHCTIKMGELPEELKGNIGLPVQMKVSGVASNDKVSAVRCEVPTELAPFMKNTHPHITLAINKKAGGAAKMSNDLLASSPKLPGAEEISITGVIQEVPFSPNTGG
jgi:hypothetical protein